MFLHLSVCSQGGLTHPLDADPLDADSQQAGGTHPTEMHSYFSIRIIMMEYIINAL